MDPSAPFVIAQGTFTTASLGATCAALYAVIKRQPPGLFAFASGLNSGIAGLAFFSTREYLVSPLLVNNLHGPQYLRRRHEFFGGVPTMIEGPTWSELRSRKVLDSLLAGALAGGGMSLWKRGRVNLLPAIATAGVLCAAAQYAVNGISIARIKFVSNVQRPAVIAPIPSEVKESFWSRMREYLGIKRLTDEEYLITMRKRKVDVERRIQELEEQIETEKVPVVNRGSNNEANLA